MNADQSPSVPSPDDADDQPAPARALWAERQGGAQYVAHNERGAKVRIGPGDAEGVFSPGELLQLALGACTTLSADHVLRSRLGDDVEAVFGVSAHKLSEENRYGSFDLELLIDRSDLDDDQRKKLEERIRRAAERQCTVGRTLAAGADYTLTITHEPLDDPS